jgi:hypothetical protein
MVRNNQSWYLFCYSRLIWQHVPLCLLPIKPPSDFSCGLKVSHKALSHFLRSQINNHHRAITQSEQPVQFPLCEFLLNASLVLTTNKATVRFHSSVKCHTKHYSLLAVKSVSFFRHINCFSGCIFTDMGQLLRLLACKLLRLIYELLFLT